MARKLPILRVAGPTILVSLLLFTACTLSAIILYRLHADTAEGLAEDIESRRKAVEIETSLGNLIRLVRKGSDQVDALNETIEQMIGESETLANTDEEQRLHARLQESFGRYHHDVWQNRLDDEAQPSGEAVRAALRILEKEVRPTVIELRDLNSRQIDIAHVVYGPTRGRWRPSGPRSFLVRFWARGESKRFLLRTLSSAYHHQCHTYPER